MFIAVSAIWAMVVTVYTGYRLIALGYLPHAELVARRTGLHDRIGPESETHSSPEPQDRDG